MKDAREGIDMLRCAVKLLDACNETFNQQFTAPELLRIASACEQSEWDLLPDEWEAQQVEDAASAGTIPRWREDERGKLIAIYEENEDEVAP